MKRRELLRNLGLGSLMTAFPSAWSNIANGAVASDRLWVVVTAPGGWDPVSFCNPRLSSQLYPGGKPMSHYTADMLDQAGNIKYVKLLAAGVPSSYGAFVEKYYRELLVINGIETNNGNHSIGVKISSSGHSSPTMPSFAAYAAAASLNADALPLPYLAAGGYVNTAGLISRVPLGGVENIPELLTANMQNGKAMLTNKAVTDLHNKRLQRVLDQKLASQLPREILEQQAFYDGQLSTQQFKRLSDKLPATLSTSATQRNIQHLCAAMAAGLTVSGQMEIRTNEPWDSHDDHDNRASINITNMFDNLDFLLTEADRHGLRNRLNVIVASDFGRTPFFNPDAGKDHWSVTSMLFIGPDFSGNRVIKLDDDNVKSRAVNLNTLAPSASGEIVTSRHVFRTLRSLTGTLGSPIDLEFDLGAPAVPTLFKV